MTISYKIDLDRENDSGIYYVHWRANVKGKLRNKRASLKTRVFEETDAALKQFLIKKGETVDTVAQSGVVYTIADLWPLYLEKLKAGRTLERAESVWEHCMRGHFGHLTVPEVTNLVVQDYIQKRTSGRLTCPGRGGRKTGRAVKGPTVRNEIVLLTACMNYSSQRKYLNELFAPTLIKGFKLPDASKPRDRVLTDDEMDRLLDAAVARSQAEGKLSRIELFIRLAYQTAGREKAVRTLTFDPKRIDFEQNFINLDDGHRLKKDKKRAVIYMDATLAAVLRRALAESDQSVPLEKRYVLGHPGQIWPTFQRVVHEAGLTPEGWVLPARSKTPLTTGISPHTLRHTAATNMLKDGVPVSHVAEFLGDTIATVERNYKHLLSGHLKAAAAVLAPKLRVVRDRDAA